MEAELDMVEEGKRDWVDLIRDFYNPFKTTLESAEKNIDKVTIADEVSDEVCDKCGRNMVIKVSKFGKFWLVRASPNVRTQSLLSRIQALNAPSVRDALWKERAKRVKSSLPVKMLPSATFCCGISLLRHPAPSVAR